ETVMPACLLECGFIDSADANQLKDTGFLNGLAESIVRGVCKAHGVAYVPPVAPKSSGPDYAGHWAESTIRFLIQEGIMKGYPGGSFRPDQYPTRAELAAAIKKAIDYVLSRK
uniref:S-layer homology domain-containing protein n=1 Tax=Effusibacillus pohliae TaxID=232270 RepID=UPI00047596B1